MSVYIIAYPNCKEAYYLEQDEAGKFECGCREEFEKDKATVIECERR
ncbi:hypothetical protein [Paraclostridium bifermentans]|nr:hypothetical protein [Paraclostridium bifermentans]